VLTPLALLLGLGLFSSVNIGLRHMLVIYPFLFLLAGRGAVALLGTAPRRAILGALAVGYVAQAVFIAPHHLSYFNILAGGPTQGHRYLIDSNYDWGQNDHFLRNYLETQNNDYQINPDPFRPTTGHILVNANALYGVLNRGRAAYRWLEGLEPTRQIAYTWFEFNIAHDTFEENPRPDAAARRELINHLFALQEHYKDVSDAGFRVALARTFSTFGAHDVAFAEIRTVLADDPTSELALAIGGELMVRYKLGVLAFEADQYLTGVHTPRPEHPLPLTPEALVSQSRTLTAGRGLSRLYRILGAALTRHGRTEEARAASDLAQQLRSIH
jgi:hypothetical protein